MKPLPDYTPAQRDTFELLQRIKMAWFAFWAIIILFTVTLGAFIYATFIADKGLTPKWILGALDGTLGLSLRAIVAHLFPPKQS